jgi:hypothetical protein
MKKKLVLLMFAVFLVQTLWVGVAFADYNSDGDIVVSVTVLPETVETSDSTGETTFELQESVHTQAYESTGQEVDHSYIWVEINGNKVLAVDPPCALYN